MIPTPVPVLEYSARAPSLGAQQRVTEAILILGCLTVGAVFGHVMRPMTYTAVGYIQITSQSKLNMSAVTAGQQAVGAAMLTSSSTVIPALKNSGVLVTPVELTAGLKVTSIPDSLLVMVAFSDADPVRAAKITNQLMNSYVTTLPPSPGTARVANFAIAPLQADRSLLFPLIGGLLGLGLGLLLVKRRRSAL